MDPTLEKKEEEEEDFSGDSFCQILTALTKRVF
jgi:hypothetical protein